MDFQFLNNILSISGLTVILIFCSLIIRKKGKSGADYALFAWFFVITINVVAVYLVNNKLEGQYFRLARFSEVCATLHGLVLFLYVKLLTDGKLNFTSYLPHFIPFLVCLTMFIISINYRTSSFGSIAGIFYLVCSLVSMLIYLPLILHSIFNYRKVSRGFLSNDVHSQLRWLELTVYLLSCIVLLAIFSQVVFRFYTSEIPQYGNLYVNVLINVFVIVIGYNGLNQKIVLNYYQVGKLLHHDSLEKKDIQDDLMDKDAAELPAIVPADTYREELYQKLCRLMDNEKPYLDPELTLEKLARKMEMPAYLLSQIINTLGQSNFFDFINHYRVNEVIQQIHENKNRTVTLISIAIDAGFNSKTSFNRAFKKKCLCTPKEYIKKCQIL